MSENAPVRILIAALGGEGGGVLAGWLTNAAMAAGFWAQRTSIPGVAQRTGATTYYIEIVPRSGPLRPILSLNPAPGQVDVMLSSELVETGRAIQAGFVTPDRTFLIASTHRVFTVAEKSAMSDGRLDGERIVAAARKFSRQHALADMAQIAERAQSPPNAVLMGALAASKALPIPLEAFREAIRQEGKATEQNLRGFEAGLRVGEGVEQLARAAAPPSTAAAVANAVAPAGLPPDVAAIAAEGVRRLTEYQDESFAQLYVERLDRFVGKPGADAPFLIDLARLLAVRMSVEDTIRVAQLKLAEARIRRVKAEGRPGVRDIVHITEFLKPGPEELFGILPAGFARRILAFVERRGWSNASLPMKIRTTGIVGPVLLKLLASLRRFRPRSLKYADEQAWIERWLGLAARALKQDPAAAREVVLTASLVKGYGDTYKRGQHNWALIAARVIEPMLAGSLPARHFADSVTQARLAALADPDGTRLSDVVASIETLKLTPLSNAAE
jgi:indolepyruvate ferredoxin oxidoreductase beta subunit